MRYYVDVKHGSDTTGDGSAAKPFKTMTKATSLLSNGDELLINDSYGAEYADYIFDEPGTISLVGLANILIRFLVPATLTRSRAIHRPAQANVHNTSIYIENCQDIRIENANFTSAHNNPVQNPHHAHAIYAVNSHLSLVNCGIYHAWEGTGVNGELFKLYGCNATISACECSNMNNSYSDSCSVFSIDGNGAYELYENTVSNITTNNGVFRALWIKPDTRSVTVDGILVHNIESDLVDHAIGIDIDSDDSPTEFVINGAQLSNIHVGIRVSNVKDTADINRIKHCTFYKCHIAVLVIAAEVELYSLSCYGPGSSIFHEYPPGHSTEYLTAGVAAHEYSNVHVLNSIFTNVHTAAAAYTKSIIDMEHIVWNNCDELKENITEGVVNAIQYIRRIDPRYEDIHSESWGFFLLDDQSPCIDAGKKYGDPFLGLAPDIGALERSRRVRISDLPALLARSVRYSERIPLTNIDIEGMIVRGLDTYDPEVKAGREGSALRDLAVKPLIGLLSPYTTELEAIRDNMSFANFENLTEDAADALASNLFVTRKSGDVATGVVRVYFEQPVITVIPAEIEFVSAQGLRFYSVQEVSITAEEMALNFDNGLYYVDVLVEGEAVGADYNIGAGSITRATSPLPAGVTAVINPNDFAGGNNSETNQELKDRIETAITVRDLVTKKGITYVMPELFTFIKDIRPIGFRDEEMLRDEIFGYHIGGKVDIYIQTSQLVEDEKIIELAPEQILITAGTFGNVPVIRINEIEILDPLTLDITGRVIPANKWSISDVDPKTRFSIYEASVLTIAKEYVGSTLRIKYLWVPEMKTLQDWVLNSENRVVCADLVVKHMEPAFTSFHVAYYAPTEIADLQTLLEVFVYNIKSGTSLQESDIIDYCHSVGAVHVHNPFMMRVVTHKVNGEIEVQESDDQINIGRIACFTPDSITVAYMGPDPRE